jgi:hypothetical protein
VSLGVQRLAELLLLSESARCERLLMIIEPFNGYMDESGTHDDSQIIAMAGYVSTYDRWIQFEKDWGGVLRHRCLKEPFHMTDFETRHGEFCDNNYWTPGIRESLIERLTYIAKRSTVLGVGVVIQRKDYERLIPDDLKADFQNPYYLLLYFCLVLLAKWNQEIPEPCKPIRFLFDRKKGFEGEAAKLYYGVKDRHDQYRLLSDMDFGSKDEDIPLQAADLIVYEVAKEGRRAYGDPRNMRKSMDALREKMNLLVTFLQESHLREFIQIVRRSQTSG